MYPKCLLLFAFLAILGCYANDEIKDFLSNSGFQNLETNFVSEEIEVRPIKIIINETNCLQPGHQ